MQILFFSLVLTHNFILKICASPSHRPRRFRPVQVKKRCPASFFVLVRPLGIEPRYAVYKTTALPLSYGRVFITTHTATPSLHRCASIIRRSYGRIATSVSLLRPLGQLACRTYQAKFSARLVLGRVPRLLLPPLVSSHR